MPREITHDWYRLPVDDVGYIYPSTVLALDDDGLRDWVKSFERTRYGLDGWRNYKNLWVEAFGYEKTHGKHILDFGCGFGIEALQFARQGNRITLYDLTPDGVAVAQRILALHGFESEVATDPDNLPEVDIFFACGVLHHTPDGMKILAEAPAPEARLLLYSDLAWKAFGGPSFWQQMDAVGGYADWYSAEKLAEQAPDWEVVEWAYVTKPGWCMIATLRRR